MDASLAGRIYGRVILKPLEEIYPSDPTTQGIERGGTLQLSQALTISVF